MERGEFAMRPRERRETSEQDLFRSRLDHDQIINMKHALKGLLWLRQIITPPSPNAVRATDSNVEANLGR